MGDLFRKNGLRAATGTSPNAFYWIAKEYNLKMTETIFAINAVECLNRGGMVVAYLKAKSLFADGGHIVVLAGMKDNNTIIVYDPYLYKNKFNIIYKGVNRKNKVILNGNEVYISIDNFKKYNNYTLYCYEPTSTKQPSKYSEGTAIEIDVPIALTGAKQNRDVLVDDLKGTPNSQYWIHESVINKSNHIYARAIICFASGKSYLVQVFDRQFWIEENNIVKKL